MLAWRVMLCGLLLLDDLLCFCGGHGHFVLTGLCLRALQRALREAELLHVSGLVLRELRRGLVRHWRLRLSLNGELRRGQVRLNLHRLQQRWLSWRLRPALQRLHQ